MAFTREAEPIVGAFDSVFNVTSRPFGHPWFGVSDDARGVQWNAYYSAWEARALLGVNLEGMEYEDWPIARFLERESWKPQFPALAKEMRHGQSLTLSWWRDCWQAAGRVDIRERDIAPTPISLAALSEDIWRRLVKEAWQCLDDSRGGRGRRRTTVTLSGSGDQVIRDVSPHFHVNVELWRSAPRSEPERVSAVEHARQQLAPVYEFVVDRSRPGKW